MAKFKDRTIKDEWLRHCWLLVEIGEAQKAWQLFHLVTFYVWSDCDIPLFAEDYTLDVQLLFNTVRKEIDADPLHIAEKREEGKEEEEE